MPKFNRKTDKSNRLTGDPDNGVSNTDFKTTTTYIFKKSKDRMENINREVEIIIMSQKKFTELKHYLGHKKKTTYIRYQVLSTALNILSADVSQWHQCNLRLPWFIV